jgi:hypothetical protein
VLCHARDSQALIGGTTEYTVGCIVELIILSKTSGFSRLWVWEMKFSRKVGFE